MKTLHFTCMFEQLSSACGTVFLLSFFGRFLQETQLSYLPLLMWSKSVPHDLVSEQEREMAVGRGLTSWLVLFLDESDFGKQAILEK